MLVAVKSILYGRHLCSESWRGEGIHDFENKVSGRILIMYALKY